VKQSRGMDQLDRGRDIDNVLGSLTAKRKKSEQGHEGPYALSAPMDQMTGNFRERLFTGANRERQIFLYKFELLGDVVEWIVCASERSDALPVFRGHTRRLQRLALRSLNQKSSTRLPRKVARKMSQIHIEVKETYASRSDDPAQSLSGRRALESRPNPLMCGR